MFVGDPVHVQAIQIVIEVRQCGRGCEVGFPNASLRSQRDHRGGRVDAGAVIGNVAGRGPVLRSKTAKTTSTLRACGAHTENRIAGLAATPGGKYFWAPNLRPMTNQ